MIDLIALSALATALWRDHAEQSPEMTVQIRDAGAKILMSSLALRPQRWTKPQAIRLALRKQLTCPRGHRAPFRVYGLAEATYEDVEDLPVEDYPSSFAVKQEGAVVDLYYREVDFEELHLSPLVFVCKTCGIQFFVPDRVHRYMEPA